jgi:hypothetical protein
VHTQAWQINKNTLLKGKIGNSAFSFLVAGKSYVALGALSPEVH